MVNNCGVDLLDQVDSLTPIWAAQRRPAGQPPAWFRIENSADSDDGPAEILIFDQIGTDWWDVSGRYGKQFIEALREISPRRDILVSIDCPGGNVFDSLAIYNLLRARGNVDTRVVGIAASIASIILLAGRKVEMPKNALVMMDDPSRLVMGTSKVVIKRGAGLEKCADIMASIYAEKTGQSREKMRRQMKDETWFTGEEALAAGLCDECTEEQKMAPCAFDLSSFCRVPAQLAKRETRGLVAGRGRIEVGSNVWDMVAKKKEGRERYDFLRADYNALLQAEANLIEAAGPRALNSVSATITTSMLVSGATTILQNRLAPLRAFGRDFSPDPMKPNAPVVSEKVTAGGTVQTDPTTFEDGTNFVIASGEVTVTPHQYTAGGHLTNAQRNNGFKLEEWLTIKVAEFSDKIWDVCAALMTIANYTAAPYIVAAGNFDGEDMATLWGRAQKFPVKNAVLEGNFFARLFGRDQFGFDNESGDVKTVSWPGYDVVGYATRWSAAGAGVQGIVAASTAMRLVAGTPLISPRAAAAGAEMTMFTLPDIGITVVMTDWYSMANRIEWITFDVIFGADVDDDMAGILVKGI